MFRSMRALCIISAGILTASLTAAPGASAQPTPTGDAAGPVKSGVRGRVVIDPAIRDAKVWPVDEERAKLLRARGWVRRATGHGPVARITEPNPALVIAIGGLNQRDPETHAITLENGAFSPPQLLTTRAHKIALENKQGEAMTFVIDGEEVSLKAGEKRDLQAPSSGAHVFKVRELPFASASVRVLDKATLLTAQTDGILPTLPMEPGEYELAIFHGARQLHSRELPVEGGKFVAIDATVSANGVVTVSLKDGGLQIIGPGGGAP
jgi:hypothetical protein